MAAKEFFSALVDIIADTTLILYPPYLVLPTVISSTITFFSLIIYIITQNANISNTRLVYGFKPCKERIISTIIEPLHQNISDLIFDKTCKFYKHLPNELILEDEPVVTQGVIIATIIFGLIFGWFLVVMCSGKAK